MGCKGAWGGVTVVRKGDSYQGGVKAIRKVCQLMERCDGHVGGVKEMWRGVTPICMLRGSVSLRNFYLYFFLQAFTRNSNKP